MIKIWASQDCGPRAQGPWVEDGCGLLSGWALRLFRGRSLPEIREITFEIGMLGKYGLDINDPQEIPGPAVAAGEDVLGTGAAVHHIRQACRGSSRG